MQVRNGVINKTFYEVIHFPTERAWRWPGQTWQACGFLSYVYFGLLELTYREDGLRFSPCVPESLANMRLRNVRYRQATFDVMAKGAGVGGQVLLDGSPVTLIPADIEGQHTIELRLS